MPKTKTKKAPAAAKPENLPAALKPTLPKANRKIDLTKALELRLKGLPLSDIAKHFNVTKSAVSQALKPYRDLPLDQIEAFKHHKADILEAQQLRLLASLTGDDIKKMSPGSKITAAAILFDKARLQRGESTSNVSTFSRIVQEACSDDE